MEHGGDGTIYTAPICLERGLAELEIEERIEII